MSRAVNKACQPNRLAEFAEQVLGSGGLMSSHSLGIVEYCAEEGVAPNMCALRRFPLTSQGAWKLDPGSANTWVLPSDLTAARLARGYVFDTCRGVPAVKVVVARLLVTELVANAVLHGSGPVHLAVARDGEGMHVDVYDESPDPPVVIAPRPLLEHGAGMRLVAAMADRWGVAQRGDGRPGKRVWFELD